MMIHVVLKYMERRLGFGALVLAIQHCHLLD